MMGPEELKEKLGIDRASRREALLMLGAAGLGLAMIPLVPRRARAAQASYFTWGGYDLTEFFPSYIAKHGAPPDFPVYADAEEAFQKLRAGFVADVVHPCSSDVPRWRDAGLIQPVDTAKLSNWPGVFPKLSGLPGAQSGRKQWFVPFDWRQTSITYRTDLVDLQGGVESWGILWDQRYKDKLAMIGAAEDSWWCAAIYAGVDVDNVKDSDVEKVRKLLIQQRPLLRMYSSDMTLLEQALASGELVAAMTWNETALSLKQQGLPVKFANPKEGALTWCCGMVLHHDAPNPDKAHDLINAMIDPNVGAFLVNEFGIGHSNVETYKLVDEAALLERGLSKRPVDIIDNSVFVQDQAAELTTKINRDWDEVIAGF